MANPKKTYFDYLFVGIQIALFVLFILKIEIEDMNIFGKYGQIAGILISIFGIVIVIWAVLQLKNSLTAYPTPKDNSQLITNGLYHFVRHPIYTGILLFCFGYAMYSQSIWRLIISLSLLILFNFKAKYEEKKLTEKFSDYPLYCKTTGRFFPKLFI